MFGDSSTALCLVSAAQLSSSPSSSPVRWIQVAGQEVASWTLALCAAQHRPVSTNLTNNQTSTSQISLHEQPHHITDLNPSVNIYYLCSSVYPALHSFKWVRGQGHELQIWKHWKMDQMIIALCFTVSQKQGSSSGQSVDMDTSQSAADHQFRLPGLRRTFCQSLELLLAGEGGSWRVKPAK